MSVSDETRQREALDRAVIEAAEAYEARYGDTRKEMFGITDGGPIANLIDAVRGRRAALAPPLPERRRWIVETEDRPALIGESFLYPADYTMKGQTIGKCNTVSPAIVHVVVSVARDLLDGYVPDANTVTLKPGQYVVEQHRVDPVDEFLGMSGSGTVSRQRAVSGFAAVVVCEYTPPTTEGEQT